MATRSPLQASFAFTVCAFAALYVAACGGSTSILDNPGGSAGSVSVAGSAGVAGSVGRAGAGGSIGTAGTGSTAGTGGRCFAACPAIACPAGYTLEPGECCPVCVPNGGSGGASGTAGAGNAGGVGGCGDIACINIGCGPGTTPVVEPGSCCPTCVPDSEACAAGEKGYQMLLGSLLAQPGAASCKIDDDCTLLSGSAQCGAACSPNAVNILEAKDTATQLDLWAQNYCSACMPIYPPCVAPPKPFCEAGQCQLYHAL